MTKLYLIPTPISEDITCISPQSHDLIQNSTHFICERVRTIRRFIKSIIPDFDIDAATFIEWDKRSPVENNIDIVDLLDRGEDVVFMSEAGSPCIADPGATLVNIARKKKYDIYPISGPSAIMLALMASGMDGQRFTFRGYLPVKKEQLSKELKQIEKTINQSGYTQIFIETPYRNLNIFNSILKSIPSQKLRMSVALDVNGENQYIKTKSLNEWSRDKQVAEILSRKTPCIFLLGR